MEERPIITDWAGIVLIWLAGLGAAAQYGKLSVVFARLPEMYPDAGAALGFVVSLVGGVGIVLGVVAGVLVAQLGYRTALLGGLIAGGLLSALQAFWPPLPLFLALRVLEGAAHLAIVVAAPSLIAELAAPRDQGRALTLWGSFFGVAFAGLAFFGVPFAERFGLAALLIAHAVYMGAMAMVLQHRLPSTRRGSAVPKVSALGAAHLRLYRSPRLGAAAY